MMKFKEYTWPEVREVIKKADPILAQIIDAWDPGKEYTFTEITYPFGSHVLDINNSGFQIPLPNGKTIPLSDPLVPDSLRKKLGYNYLPLGVLTQGGVVVYHELEDRVFCLAYLAEGFNLGVWEAFGPPAPYSVVSGARSLVMAPRIKDKEQHNKLRNHFEIQNSAPRNLFDQWNVFVELAKHRKTPWEIKVLFLNGKWLEEKPKSLGWLLFQNHLQRKAWEHTEYVRSKSVFEVAWKEFFAVLQKRGEKFDPYLLETAKHVISMAQGTLPAFAAVGKTELHGPTQFLMEAYEDIYSLKNHIPTMLAPVHYGRTFKDNVSVYYSFQNPTLLDMVPKIKTFSSAVDDMRGFKNLMGFFLIEKENLAKTGDLSLFNQINIDYFHSETKFSGMQSSSTLPDDDPNLLYSPGKKARQFAETGSFFRCCLRISRRNNQKKI